VPDEENVDAPEDQPQRLRPEVLGVQDDPHEQHAQVARQEASHEGEAPPDEGEAEPEPPVVHGDRHGGHAGRHAEEDGDEEQNDDCHHEDLRHPCQEGRIVGAASIGRTGAGLRGPL
jgi:hypothetical protein